MAQKELDALPTIPINSPGFMRDHSKRKALEHKVQLGEKAKKLICEYSDRSKTRNPYHLYFLLILFFLAKLR